MRLVTAARQLDVDRVCPAIGLIVRAEFLAQPASLDTDEGIGVGIERIGAPEDFKGDAITLQPAAAADESFMDDVFQKALTAWGGSERTAPEDAVHLLSDGFPIALIPVVE